MPARAVWPDALRGVEALRLAAEPDAPDVGERILRNYANCITSEDPEQRRQVAMGIAELAPLYADCDERFFIETIRTVGVQLAEEKFSELQSVVELAMSVQGPLGLPFADRKMPCRFTCEGASIIA